MKLHHDKLPRQLKKAGALILGNLILAFLVAAFVLPHGIIVGGGTGIGILVNHFFHLDTALVVLLFNLAMLALGWAVLGKQFFLNTVASSLLYPAFLSVMERIPGIGSITSNTLMATLLAGGLLGICLGLLMGNGSSTGGTDVLNLVINKWFHIPVSTAVYLVDILILGCQVLVFPTEDVLYGVILLVVETLVLDRFLVSGQAQLQIMVISEKHEQLRLKLLTELEAGVTMLCIETGFARQRQEAVLCVIPNRKLHAATELIQAIDPGAFITVTQIKEVRGQGFTWARQPSDPQSR